MHIKRGTQTLSQQKLTSRLEKVPIGPKPTCKKDEGEEFTEEDSVSFISWRPPETTTMN